MMSKVFVLDIDKQPLTPVHPGGARYLLKQGKAAVYRRYPFTIILRAKVENPAPTPLRLKIDPGAKTTGFALTNDMTGEVIWAAELEHRGTAIKRALDKRRAVRRGRRTHKTPYRVPRFRNRRRRVGWLPPSLISRVENILTWVRRLSRLCNIMALSQELVRFDLQKLDQPEIAGVQYQQGTLQGYEIREYLLEKWQRSCAYCDTQGVPLQVEHILCRAKGGTDRISNLALACEPCNLKKGTQDIRDFLAHDPERLARILAQAKSPLKAATAVNATRWELFRRLKETGLPLETGSGSLTKYNRAKRGLPKTHWLDAAAVGASTPLDLHTANVFPLLIKATGHGHRRMCNPNEIGLPVSHRKRRKRYFGYQTGDLVRVVVPETLACQGTHVGRVAVRARGTFNITTKRGKVTDVPYRFCTPIGRTTGYSYQTGERHAAPPTTSP
jgi:5-methylcytosine-specific restriction endonuclease McrA